MDRNGPRQPQGQLLKRSDNLLLYALLLLVVSIFIIPPGGWLHQMFHPILQQHIYSSIRIYARHHANRTVHPAAIPVIVNKDHLCLLLDGEPQLGR